MLVFTAALALAALAAVQAVPGCNNCDTYSFDAPHGYLVTGAMDEFGPFALSEKDSMELRIYDTTPKVPPGADPDLEVNAGGALIVQNDESGIIPDDDPDGGVLVFDFSCPLTVKSITFIDTERFPFVKFFDAFGNLIANEKGPKTGDKNTEKKNFDVTNVKKMQIIMRGSGGINEIELCLCTIHTFDGPANGFLIPGVQNVLGPFAVIGTPGFDIRIYDTTPATPPGADPDLEVGQGNAVIIQDPNSATVPDDFAGGGDIQFVFPCEVTIKSVTFIDTEKFPFVKFYDNFGNLLNNQQGAKTGDKQVATKQFGVMGVRMMEITLRDSGAIGAIETCCPCVPPVPRLPSP